MTSPADRLSAALTAANAGYRIERELGAGGMATVYLAEDLKHDRKVAIKVLKPELAAVLGAERFVVEIKTTAAMSHPHILPLFDSGTADGFLFYVMPYIQGETIREKLNRETQFGVDEAVRIAREVADALDYAHRHGVIHRDIKPENILLHDGRAMVMDFGIALAVSAAAGGRLTETGLSLGTPHYMSPEQATAEKEITARSDQYSLASVLYEMLAGQPPHIGGAAQAVIMKIITEPAQPVTAHRKNVSPNVSAALAKALEKVPADRFETAKAFADALANPSFTTTGVSGATLSGTAGHRGVSRRALTAVSAVAVILAAGLVWALLRPPSVPEAHVVRGTIELSPGERILDANPGAIAVSPQGDRVVYSTTGPAGLRTVARRTSELVGRVLNSSSSWANLAISPDDRWLAYTIASSNEIMKMPLEGGASLSLGRAPAGTVTGMSWTPDNQIIVGSSAGLWVVSGGGGTPQRLTADAVGLAAAPVALPDGKTVLFSTGATDDVRRLGVMSLSSRTVTVLDVPGIGPLGLRDGHLLYVTRAGALMALPFDAKRLRATGDPFQVHDSVRLSGGVRAPIASLSASGTLSYLSGASDSHLVLSAPGRPDTPVIAEAHGYNTPRFSPDGRKVAVTVMRSGTSDIWVYDMVAHTFAMVTTEGRNGGPEWSPDGARILFRSDLPEGGRAILWQPADRSAKSEVLYQPDQQVNEALISPDAKWLLFRTSPGARDPTDILAVPLTGDKRSVIPLVTGPAVENLPRFSPDGRWIAYQSNEGGRFEIYVRPFPGAGARVQVSNEGGTEPVWARSGRALFYRTVAGIVSVAVTTGATFSLGERRVALPGDYLLDPTHANYDVSRDGSQFLMLKQAGAQATPIVVHNWGRELREKLAAGKR